VRLKCCEPGAEMYGYSFGTASADVWHKVDFEAMLYPSYLTYGVLRGSCHPTHTHRRLLRPIACCA
jgi:hypothetical protein